MEGSQEGVDQSEEEKKNPLSKQTDILLGESWQMLLLVFRNVLSTSTVFSSVVADGVVVRDIISDTVLLSDN